LVGVGVPRGVAVAVGFAVPRRGVAANLEVGLSVGVAVSVAEGEGV